MITFYGEPTTALETELQLGSSSRFVAHWPPAENKKQTRALARPDAFGGA